ncbi:hypothetical protein [cf. Phormidesmis sp. LEGE 11477]|uniref:hypothetical protein n=1 Tax=cf. Phormidesmis sp. LEGE 11477 TaxID=1828680 RepID=UPI0018811F14|nr:hypothetical protein [cf. Phormidesmis sp. LEGE 11477]MBE9061772.1 hypothetical protein [cf. Phormidesmis sp. LEGE 11477]
MRARIDNGVLFLRNEDVPAYKKKGSIVRNSYFWALKSIADRAPFQKEWEFEERVWIALTRMLTSFAESGYLGLRETQLEFEPDDEIPAELRTMSTWLDPDAYAEEPEAAEELPWPYDQS